MKNLVKEAVTTYLYWIGIIYGFALMPISLIAATGLIPPQTPLVSATLAGLLLLALDPPHKWQQPPTPALLTRFTATGFATMILLGYDITGITGVSYKYGSTHWTQTLTALTLSWITYATATTLSLKHHKKPKNIPDPTHDAIRIFTHWIGIFLGIFYIPAGLLASAGTILMVFPLYGIFITGLVLLKIDPPHHWKKPHHTALIIRVTSSAIAAILMIIFDTFIFATSREIPRIYIRDWSNNLTTLGGCWLIYAIAAGIAVLSHNSSRNKTIENPQ